MSYSDIRKRKENPLVGIVLIVIIAAIVKSCAGKRRIQTSDKLHF